MKPGDEVVNELAAARGTDVDTTHALVAALCARAGAERFYVFRVGGAGAQPSVPRRARTLLAFATPDVALAFAQHNGFGANPSELRLQRLSLARLLLAMLREPAIAAILLVRDLDELPPAGYLPDGIRIERAEILG